MEWFRKDKTGVEAQERREIPEGLWHKCESCGEIIYSKKLEQSLWVCPACSFHFRIPCRRYIGLLLDEGALEEYDNNLASSDPLEFKDSKRYTDRIRAATEAAGPTEGLIAGIGAIGGRTVSFAIMDFAYIGGSMGSVIGEKVSRAIERAIERGIPLIIISCSGGARMQEGVLSLMQMAKTSALLAVLAEKRLPFISVVINPTTGGVMASFAALGDVIIAEPKALLGFAGPRVIKQTIGQDLPEGFQSSEFQMDKGFVDIVIDRKGLRPTIISLMEYMCKE